MGKLNQELCSGDQYQPAIEMNQMQGVFYGKNYRH
jgi:hypothetical protein